MSNRKLMIRRNRKSLHQAPHPVFVDLHFLKNRETKANNKSNDDTTISRFRKIKFRYFEKATQFWKKSSPNFFEVMSNWLGEGFFKIFKPSQNILTLIMSVDFFCFVFNTGVQNYEEFFDDLQRFLVLNFPKLTCKVWKITLTLCKILLYSETPWTNWQYNKVFK